MRPAISDLERIPLLVAEFKHEIPIQTPAVFDLHQDGVRAVLGLEDERILARHELAARRKPDAVRQLAVHPDLGAVARSEQGFNVARLFRFDLTIGVSDLSIRVEAARKRGGVRRWWTPRVP